MNIMNAQLLAMSESENGSNCDCLSVLHSVHCEEHDNDFSRMKKIILDDPASLTRKCENHKTYPLHHAALMKHVKCIQLFLESGADPNLFESERETNALLLTLRQFQSEITSEDANKLENIIELLIKHGIHAEVPSGNSIWNLQYIACAIYSKNSRVMKMLLDHGCKIEDLNVDPEIKERMLYKVHLESECEKMILCSVFSTGLTSAIMTKSYEAFKLLLLYNSTLYVYFPLNSYPVGIARFIVNSVLSQKIESDIEKIIDYVYSFYLHGGTLWLTPLPGKPKRSLKKKYALPQVIRNRKLNLPSAEILARKIEVLMSEPLSLQNQCRIAFKKVFRREYCKKIELLPLPNDIISFLRFSDLP